MVFSIVLGHHFQKMENIKENWELIRIYAFVVLHTFRGTRSDLMDPKNCDIVVNWACYIIYGWPQGHFT